MIRRKCAALGAALLTAGALATTTHEAAAAEKTCPYTSSIDRPALTGVSTGLSVKQAQCLSNVWGGVPKSRSTGSSAPPRRRRSSGFRDATDWAEPESSTRPPGGCSTTPRWTATTPIRSDLAGFGRDGRRGKRAPIGGLRSKWPRTSDQPMASRGSKVAGSHRLAHAHGSYTMGSMSPPPACLLCCLSSRALSFSR